MSTIPQVLLSRRNKHVLKRINELCVREWLLVKVHSCQDTRGFSNKNNLYGLYFTCIMTITMYRNIPKYHFKKSKIVTFHWHVIKIILVYFSSNIILLRVKYRLPLVDTFISSFANDTKYKQNFCLFWFLEVHTVKEHF